jgi:hypothetical protein
MKRQFLAVPLGIALLAVPAAAQSSFGIVGGFVNSEVELSSEGFSLGLDSRNGFAIGASMEHRMSSTVSFAPEAMYVTKGFAMEAEGTAAGLKFGYLEVPLLFRAAFGSEGASARPWVTAGPSIAFKLSCDATVEAEGVEAEADCSDIDEEDPVEFKSIDFGVMFGAGVDFGRFGASVRYDLGLANIIDSNEDVSYKNRALMLLGSVRF